jgi:ferredoxin
MSSNVPTVHFVCTIDEAVELISDHGRFWVSNCGCREGKGTCSRSRMDVCLMFHEELQPSGSSKREISRTEVDAIVTEARRVPLVPRPFRSEDRTRVDGVCFCCDDCCAYFENFEEPCDKGRFIERTDRTRCSECGACVPVCHFGARMVDGELRLSQDRCFGCGLCGPACPTTCIEMVKRV